MSSTEGNINPNMHWVRSMRLKPLKIKMFLIILVYSHLDGFIIILLIHSFLLEVLILDPDQCPSLCQLQAEYFSALCLLMLRWTLIWIFSEIFIVWGHFTFFSVNLYAVLTLVTIFSLGICCICWTQFNIILAYLWSVFIHTVFYLVLKENYLNLSA